MVKWYEITDAHKHRQTLDRQATAFLHQHGQKKRKSPRKISNSRARHTIFITTGPLVNGCLRTHNFASHADAAKAGFPWAGKETASQCTQRRVPSPHEIAAAATPAGGWTAAQLAEWGVPWPPPRGWRGKLEVQWLQSRKMPVR